MNHPCNDPHNDWPETMAAIYRSEGFAEDLEDFIEPAPAWHLAPAADLQLG